jgi:hypothetical protein
MTVNDTVAELNVGSTVSNPQGKGSCLLPTNCSGADRRTCGQQKSYLVVRQNQIEVISVAWGKGRNSSGGGETALVFARKEAAFGFLKSRQPKSS